MDVPGHERFVRNMLAGAGGIDVVMLCVAADESVMPQTREHFQICRLLEIPAGVLVLTKADLADADMIEIAALELRELVAGSRLEGAPLVSVSAKTGAGLSELVDRVVAVASGVRARRSLGPPRLPVDRVFSARGFGTVVTGTLVSGRIGIEDGLVMLPSGAPVKVRGLQVHGRQAPFAEAGQRVAANLGGIERAGVSRGDTLCRAGTLEPTRRMDVVLEVLPEARPLKHGARVRFHQGTTEVIGRVAIAAPRGDGGGAAGEIAPGRSGYARVRLEGPAVVTRGDRFILRAYSPLETVGGGVILDPHPPRTAIRTAAALERFRRLEGSADPEGAAAAAVLTFIEERAGGGMPRGAMISRAGLDANAARAIEAGLVADKRVTVVGDTLVAAAALAALEARLGAAVAAHHTAEPLSGGLPREEARERLFKGAAPAVFEHVLSALVARGALSGGDRLTTAGREVSLSADEARARETIERLVQEAGLAPPAMAAIVAAAGVAAAVVERVAALLVRQKQLVRIDGLLFDAAALERLKADVRAQAGSGEGEDRVDVAAFKARYGISRKYAIPLLEYLDKERVTRRVGDARVVRRD